MREKGFYQYLSAEDHIQILVNRKLSNLRIGNRSIKWIHIPNEGNRSPYEQYKFKALGGQSGWPDILVFESNWQWRGLAIELKTSEKEFLRRDGEIRKIEHIQGQLKKLIDFASDGWYACFSGGYEKTEQLINQYFKKPESLKLPEYIIKNAWTQIHSQQ